MSSLFFYADTLVNVRKKPKWTDNEIKEQRNKTPCEKMIMVQRQTEKEVVTRRKGHLSKRQNKTKISR